MKKQYFFLALIIIGILGKWVVMPSVKRMKMEQKALAEKQQKEVVTSCFSRGKCSITELLSLESQNGNRRELLRNYVLKNWNEISSQSQKTAWYLRAQVITAEDIKQSFLDSVLALDKNLQHSFLKGLSLCHNRHCLDFGKKFYTSWSQEEFFEEVSLIRIKVPGHWSKKNKILKGLLDTFEYSGEFTKAVALIDFIPNHPSLKKFLEVNYLKIIGQSNIDKVALHLARYNSGWHDRSIAKIMGSLSNSHIDSYLRNMKVGCPQKVLDIYKFRNGWNSVTKEVARVEAKYLFNQSNEITRELGLKDIDFVSESKCLNKREAVL
jgi:hypothetical protein